MKNAWTPSPNCEKYFQKHVFQIIYNFIEKNDPYFLTFSVEA